MKIKGIACISKEGGLSKEGKLPWLDDKISDLEYVRTMTTQCKPTMKNILIVGRKTYDTLPRSLLDSTRELYILSRETPSTILPPLNYFKDPKELYRSLLDRYYNKKDIDQIYVFGGAEIYKIFLENGWINSFHLTRIQKSYECDTYFPLHLLENGFQCTRTTSMDTKNRIFQKWTRLEHPEYNYLQLLERVYYSGNRRSTRNSETISIFGANLEFDILKHGFPLLTTKKMFYKGILKELLWFIKGRTDSNELSKEGVNIWRGNTTREFLDSIGLSHYPEGCAGPIYGYQWRHFNAPYDPTTMTNLEPGFDQLMNVIQELRTNPTSRRLVISGWNPAQMSQMCLPPCHVLYQFYVENENLCCQMYQRSADLFLGLPFNIASTSLLTYIIASMTNYNVGKVRISIGDAHIYSDHTANVLEQITRKPLEFCKLSIKNKREKLEDWEFEDFTIENYRSHEALKSLMIA